MVPLTSTEIAAARGLLGWEQRNLAFAAGVSIGTVRRMEDRTLSSGVPHWNFPVRGRRQVVGAIAEALEYAGVRFMTTRTSVTNVAVGLEPWAGQDERPFQTLVMPWVNEERPFTQKATFVRYGFARVVLATGKQWMWVLTELPNEPGSELAIENSDIVARAATYAVAIPRGPFVLPSVRYTSTGSKKTAEYWVLVRPAKGSGTQPRFSFHNLDLKWLGDEERRFELTGSKKIEPGHALFSGPLFGEEPGPAKVEDGCLKIVEDYAHVDWSLFPKSEARPLQFGPQSWDPTPVPLRRSASEH